MSIALELKHFKYKIPRCLYDSRCTVQYHSMTITEHLE